MIETEKRRGVSKQTVNVGATIKMERNIAENSRPLLRLVVSSSGGKSGVRALR